MARLWRNALLGCPWVGQSFVPLSRGRSQSNPVECKLTHRRPLSPLEDGLRSLGRKRTSWRIAKARPQASWDRGETKKIGRPQVQSHRGNNTMRASYLGWAQEVASTEDWRVRSSLFKTTFILHTLSIWEVYISKTVANKSFMKEIENYWYFFLLLNSR